jgi:CRISPR/Cas system-associated exonuclease Cas4 (RecB family)
MEASSAVELPEELLPENINAALDQRVWEENDWASPDRRTGAEPIRANNYMSQAGRRCERNLFYERTAQSRKAPFTVAALRRMREGKRHERHAIADLEDAGYTWKRDQHRVFIDKVTLSGKIEGYLVAKGDNRRILGEIKSFEHQAWRSLTTIDSLLANKWYRRYVYQLNCYLFAEAEVVGMMVLRSRSDGAMRFLPYRYDPKMHLEVERKLRRVNKAVKKNEAPPQVADWDECSGCDFKVHCGPDVLSNEPGVALMAEVEAGVAEKRINELMKLKAANDRYNALNEWKKARFAGVESMIVGPWLVTGKQAGKAWRVEIARVAEA